SLSFFSNIAVFVYASRKLTFADLFEFLSAHIIYENIWSRFKKTLFSHLQTTVVSEISYEISIYNLGEVSIEFQENNNGLRFFTQTVHFYGNKF
ncbi:MAG: hypothetical protein IKU41_00945, partial [Clostridia bacterium]|nr:hypothetical protein [Clostridia bacterium]